MIIDVILQIPLFFLKMVLALIPSSGGLPAGVGSAISTAVGYIRGVSFIFPIETLFTILLLILGIEAGLLVWKFINWLIKKVPGMS